MSQLNGIRKGKSRTVLNKTMGTQIGTKLVGSPSSRGQPTVMLLYVLLSKVVLSIKTRLKLLESQTKIMNKMLLRLDSLVA